MLVSRVTNLREVLLSALLQLRRLPLTVLVPTCLQNVPTSLSPSLQPGIRTESAMLELRWAAMCLLRLSLVGSLLVVSMTRPLPSARQPKALKKKPTDPVVLWNFRTLLTTRMLTLRQPRLSVCPMLSDALITVLAQLSMNLWVP